MIAIEISKEPAMLLSSLLWRKLVRAIDLTGQTFGRWTVLYFVGTFNKKTNVEMYM